jgi:hypothetical protein
LDSLLCGKPGYSAEVDRKGKDTKYKAACVANGLELLLLPLIIEYIGRIDEPCDDFLRNVLKRNDSVHRAYTNYWLSPSKNCYLRKSIAASIVNRSKLINGGMLHNPNYQFEEAFILEFGFRY